MRHLCLVLFLAATAAVARPVPAADAVTPAEQARLLRLNGHAEESRALLEPLLASQVQPPAADVVEQYILSIGQTLDGDALRAKIEELTKRFGDRAALYTLRTQLLEETDPTAALAEAEKGLKAFPDDVSLAAAKAYCLMDRDPAEALTWLHESAVRHPKSETIQYWLGSAYEANEEPADARAAFRNASALSPGWIDPLLDLAGLHVNDAEFDKALALIRQAEKIEPDSLDVKERLLTVLAKASSPPEVLESVWADVQKILDRTGRDVQSLARAATAAQIIGDSGRRKALADEILQKYPTSTVAGNLRFQRDIESAQTLIANGKPLEAEPLLRGMLETVKQPDRKQFAYQVLYTARRGDAARQLAALDEWAAWLESGELAKIANPTSTFNAHMRLSALYSQIGTGEKALTWAMRAKESIDAARRANVPADMIDSMTSVANRALAIALFKSGKPADAKPLLLEMFKMDSEDSEVRTMLGRIALGEKDWKAAEDHLTAAYRLAFFGAAQTDDLRKLYVARSGSDKGWDAYLAETRSRESEVLKKRTIAQFTSARQPLAEFDLSRYGADQRLSTKSFAGKITVLSLWASWCTPCREELSKLQNFYAAHSKDPGIGIWAVNVQESTATIEKFLQGKGFEFPILMDDKAWDHFNIEGIPHTYVLDAKGMVRFELDGYDPGVDYQTVLEWLVEAAK